MATSSPYPAAGSMDQKITIQSSTETKSTSGAPTFTWATYATAWAKIDYQGGGESIEGGKIVSTDTITFTIRYTSGVLPKMRISYNSQVFHIKSIVILGRQRYLVIKTEREQ